MRAICAIARREYAGMLYAPAGWIIAALFMFLCSLMYLVVAPNLFGTGFRQGQPASLRVFFETAAWVLFLIAPALSMRTISDELRTGTIETLLTAPVSERTIMIGKYLGSMGVLATILLPTLFFAFLLEMHGRPDPGETLCGYLGLLLLGSACLASGMFFSCLTASQVLAFLTTVFFWMILLIATLGLPAAAHAFTDLAGQEGGGVWLLRVAAAFESAASLAGQINPVQHLRRFVHGLVDTYSIAVFVALTAGFLVASMRALEWRRWL